VDMVVESILAYLVTLQLSLMPQPTNLPAKLAVSKKSISNESNGPSLGITGRLAVPQKDWLIRSQNDITELLKKTPHASPEDLSILARAVLNTTTNKADRDKMYDIYNKLVDYTNNPLPSGNISKNERNLRTSISNAVSFGYPENPTDLTDIMHSIEAASSDKDGAYDNRKDKDKLNLRHELIKQYLGINNDNKYIVKSAHLPTKGNKDSEYYDYSPNVKQSIIKSLKGNFNETQKIINQRKDHQFGEKQVETGVDRFGGLPGAYKDPFFALGQLGAYSMTNGQDERGPYISYYDKWDLNPKILNGTGVNLNSVNKPFEIYGRIYKDEFDNTKSVESKNGIPFMDSRINVNKSAYKLPIKGFNTIENKKVLDWTNQYVNSPKYKERLTPFYKYPDYIQKQRSGLTGSLTVRNNPGTGSGYYSNGNEVALSPLEAQATGASTDEILAHEAAHSVNSNDRVKGAQLSPQETDFILKRNKNISTQDINRFAQLSKDTGKPIQDVLKDNLHDVNPSENHSDINALRYLMNKRGLYDASKQDLDPATLKKAAQDPAINRSFIWKRLKDSFDDKALIEIMNKVAVNKNSNQSNTA
jgi:hypothetical protein